MRLRVFTHPDVIRNAFLIHQITSTETLPGVLAKQPMDYTESGPPSNSFRTHAANVAFIVLAIGVLFWRVFLVGETLIDVAALDNQLPWGYYAAPSDYPYNRTDLTDTYLTREYFVVQAYRDGETPLWNPYTMAGHPIYADGVTHTMSPFLLFYSFLDLPLGYSVARISELMLAAVFMYIFLIGIGVGPRSSLLGSLVFVSFRAFDAAPYRTRMVGRVDVAAAHLPVYGPRAYAEEL